MRDYTAHYRTTTRQQQRVYRVDRQAQHYTTKCGCPRAGPATKWISDHDIWSPVRIGPPRHPQTDTACLCCLTHPTTNQQAVRDIGGSVAACSVGAWRKKRETRRERRCVVGYLSLGDKCALGDLSLSTNGGREQGRERKKGELRTEQKVTDIYGYTFTHMLHLYQQ